MIRKTIYGGLDLENREIKTKKERLLLQDYYLKNLTKFEAIKRINCIDIFVHDNKKFLQNNESKFIDTKIKLYVCAEMYDEAKKQVKEGEKKGFGKESWYSYGSFMKYSKFNDPKNSGLVFEEIIGAFNNIKKYSEIEGNYLLGEFYQITGLTNLALNHYFDVLRCSEPDFSKENYKFIAENNLVELLSK